VLPLSLAQQSAQESLLSLQEFRSIWNQSSGSKAMDVPAPANRGGCNGSIGSPSDDPYGAAMMNFDGYSELCSSPSLTDQLFSLLNDSSTHQMFAMWSSLGSGGASKEFMGGPS
jgi:hypothetical protein